MGPKTLRCRINIEGEKRCLFQLRCRHCRGIWVLLPPLLGFLILGLLGRIMPRGAILTVAWGAVGIAFLFALGNFVSLLGTPVAQRVSDQPVYQWVLSGSLSINFGIYYDALTA